MSLENLLPNQAEAKNPQEGIARLIRILELLRKECPWDRKQTWDSLRTLTIEETFELSDALTEKDYDEVRKELGDVLLHIAFYAQIGKEENRFDFTDVCNGICEKLIRRHPHVFAQVEADTAEDVKKNWEEIKLHEGKKHSVLSGVPKSLPAMIKAYRIQDKARGVGFDWENGEQVWEKVQEELSELRVEVSKGKVLQEGRAAVAERFSTAESRGNACIDFAEAQKTSVENQRFSTAESRGNACIDFAEAQKTSVENQLEAQKEKTLSELGDVFFALINYARFIGLNPEDALEHTNRKFIRRFTYLEEQTIQKGKSLHEMSLQEMDRYWEEAKKKGL